MKSALHRVTVADGSLLEVACGVESVVRRFDAIVERYAPPTSVTSAAEDSRSMDILLGMVAIRERLAGTFSRAAVLDETPPEASRTEESWLR